MLVYTVGGDDELRLCFSVMVYCISILIIYVYTVCCIFRILKKIAAVRGKSNIL